MGGIDCTTDGANICTACTGSFYLNGATASCDAWAAACSAGEFEEQAPSITQNRVCTANSCTCDNGVAKTGSECASNGASMCKSCNAGWTLNSANTACDGESSTADPSTTGAAEKLSSAVESSTADPSTTGAAEKLSSAVQNAVGAVAIVTALVT